MQDVTDRPPILAVYHRGLGHDPVTVVGISTPAVAVNTAIL
jgi:hypothetical protein